jgi:hypothetical protein
MGAGQIWVVCDALAGDGEVRRALKVAANKLAVPK